MLQRIQTPVTLNKSRWLGPGGSERNESVTDDEVNTTEHDLIATYVMLLKNLRARMHRTF
jgi:hypothetical protein